MTTAVAVHRPRDMEATVMPGAPNPIGSAAAVARRFVTTWGLVEWGDAVEAAASRLVGDVLRSRTGPMPENCRPFAVRIRVRWTSSNTVLIEAWGILTTHLAFAHASYRTTRKVDPEYWICRVDRLRVRGCGYGVRYA